MVVASSAGLAFTARASADNTVKLFSVHNFASEAVRSVSVAAFGSNAIIIAYIRDGCVTSVIMEA